MFKPENTAEVFSGGACKCFALVGVMRAKEELRITDADFGAKTFKESTSGSTFVQAIMAEGTKSNLIDEYFKKNESLMKKIFPIDIFSMLHLHNGTIDENGYIIDAQKQQIANSGFVNPRNLEKFLKDFLGDVTFKERPELEFTAVDWKNKEPIYLNYKTCPDLKVVEGCMTSAAIPGMYPARRIKHNGKWKYCIDGGVIESLPIKRTLENKKIKDIFAVTFTDLFPEERHSGAWWEFLVPSVGLCAAYNEKKFMSKLLKEDYLNFVSNKEVKKIRYHGRRINLAVLAPKIDSKYFFEPNYKNFQELSKIGYDDSKRVLKKLAGIQKKHFFFF